MKRKIVRIFKKSYFIVYILTFLSAGNILSYDSISQTEIHMDTYVKITIEKISNYKIILKEAFKKIENLENKLSIFKPDSEISLLNKKGRLSISKDIKGVLHKSLKISQLTDGAFDITCKPLIDLYKKAEKRNFPPTLSEIKKTLKFIGWEKIKIERDFITLKKGMELDLGGIAKGFVADEIVKFLKSKGVRNGLINAGGDAYCFGLNPEGKKWRIGIRNPKEKIKIIKIIEISEKGIVTSGDYERYMKIKGKKYSHIVNPKTGKTVQDFPVSVTIIASDCTTADGLATGCFVLGTKKGLKLLNKIQGIEGLIIDGNMKIYKSKNFE